MVLMTVKEVAEFMKTTRATIDKWLFTGTLPRDGLTLKVGAKVYFVKEKLIDFLNSKAA